MISSTLSDKVLTVGPDPFGKGGIASVVQYYRDELFPKWNFIAEACPEGGKLSKLFDAFSASFKLISVLRSDKKIKIVHLHTAGKVSFPRSCVFMHIAKLMGRKVVMHMHSGTFPSYCAGKEKKVKNELSKADVIIVLGEIWKSYYQETFGISNLYAVPNIVPDVSLDFDISRRFRQEEVHALFLGQLVDTKGIYDLLESISLVREGLKDRFKLHVGGKGDVNRFMGEIRRLGLEGIVIFEGWVSDEKKIDLLKMCSISILPSYFEGLPISLLEGMAYYHALVATDVGSIPEILDSSNGFIFAPGKTEDISAALVNLTDDKEKLRRMGEVSRTKVKPYLPDSVANSLSVLYEDLLK